MQFEAHEIHFAVDSSFVTAAFRGADSHYLILSRDLQSTEQDAKLGHDQVYIELDEQIHSTYGGIAFGTLYPERLELALDNSGSGNVGTTTITVDFSLPPERLANLRDVIKSLFDGYRNFAIVP